MWYIFKHNIYIYSSFDNPLTGTILLKEWRNTRNVLTELEAPGAHWTRCAMSGALVGYVKGFASQILAGYTAVLRFWGPECHIHSSGKLLFHIRTTCATWTSWIETAATLAVFLCGLGCHFATPQCCSPVLNTCAAAFAQNMSHEIWGNQLLMTQEDKCGKPKN